jgi:molecular chaperone GrpE
VSDNDTPVEELGTDDVPSSEAPVDPPLPEEDAVAVAARERDDYLDALRRLQAEFENYKKRMLRQQTETLERASQGLVEKLLPVLDAIDLARSHGTSEDLEQVAGALLDVLRKEGLERIDPVGEPFDPTEQEAVQHEPGEGEDPVVATLFRAGWRWKGRVLRPAAVGVRG